MKRLSRPLIFGVIFFILSFAITVQLRVTSTSESSASQEKVTRQLKDEIFALNTESDKLLNKYEKTEKNLEVVRDQATANDTSGKEKSDLIKKYTILAGYTDVSGQGIVVKYYPKNDSQNSDVTKDLIDIVNELKNAGAEAISVNEKRITINSSIEMEKNEIIIDGEKIAAPYTIKAIGNSETMNSSLIRPGGTIEMIRNTGLKIELIISKKISINKYSKIDI